MERDIAAEVAASKPEELYQEGLHHDIDHLQLSLGQLHGVISDNYFAIA